MLEVAGECHHLVQEGLQHVLCQPGLGAQDLEERLGAEGVRSLLARCPPHALDPPLGAPCMAPDRGVSGQGTICQQEEILGSYLTPSLRYLGDIPSPATNYVTRPFPGTASSRPGAPVGRV